MKKILIAIDDSKGSIPILEKFAGTIPSLAPELVALLYVEKIEGGALIDETMSDSELSALKEALKGTEYQEALDRKAKTVLDYYEKALSDKGVTRIKRIIKEGHPAEEILKTADEEDADLIVVGSRGRRRHAILMGSVSREVSNRADIPVLIVK